MVVFPTETVYGLGADAFNAEAVARVYSEKGRPGDNPLILHIASMEDFAQLAHNPPPYAFAFIEAFWAGPLTLVARKNPTLSTWLGGHPYGTTETIGIRMPSHPVALALIKAAGCAIAAPSANKSGRPSSTTLLHVLDDFPELHGGNNCNGMVALDGGCSAVGLESTVVDITGDAPVILRPGAITVQDIGKALRTLPLIPHTGTHPLDSCHLRDRVIPRSPGMKYKHYAPYADMCLVSGVSERVAEFILCECAKDESRRCGVLVSAETKRLLGGDLPKNLVAIEIGETQEIIAQELFALFRKLDGYNVNIIYAETVPESGLGVAIMDRMKKAAEGRVVYV